MKIFLVFIVSSLVIFSCNRQDKKGETAIGNGKDTNEKKLKKHYLAFFDSIKGKACISGQFIRWNYNASLEEINNTHKTAGEWIAMLGADYYSNFQDSVPAPGCTYTLTNAVIDSYYENHGLVNLSVHFINPQTGGSAWDNEIDFDSIFIDNSRIQKNFLMELNSVATGLKNLQGKGIMIMFRPFHEMNGGWFWWGDKQRFTELWKFTYNYLVEIKNLDNLLWCWSPDAGPGNIHSYYPGDKFVDMVGLDAYSSNLPEKAKEAYKEILRYNKPFGFSEYGCVQGSDTLNAGTFDYSIFIDWLNKDFPEAVYFLVWRDHWGFNGKPGVDILLKDPRIINRDELQNAL